MQSLRVTFPGGAGHELVGRLELPDAPTTRFAVHAACFTCVKDLKSARWLSRRLTDHGVGVLRFDYTGLGESRGSFAEVTYETKIADILAAAAFLEQNYAAPILLSGHSIGGAAAIAAADRIPSLRLVATINSPSELHHLAELIRTREPQIADGAPRNMSLAGGRPVPVALPLVEDLERRSLADAIASLTKPLLVFQATRDELLKLDHAERLAAPGASPRSLIRLPDADHLMLSGPKDAEFIADVLAGWLRAYAGP
jgi:alpha/beta superfamily hydrolase